MCLFCDGLSGALVAGLNAGLVNTFPLMGGQLPPPDYLPLSPLWRNFFEDVPSVQFHHRVLAIVALVSTLAFCWRFRRQGHKSRLSLTCLAAAICLQAVLGVLALIFAVPLPLGVLHQAGALAVFLCWFGRYFIALETKMTIPSSFHHRKFVIGVKFGYYSSREHARNTIMEPKMKSSIEITNEISRNPSTEPSISNLRKRVSRLSFFAAPEAPRWRRDVWPSRGSWRFGEAAQSQQPRLRGIDARRQGSIRYRRRRRLSRGGLVSWGDPVLEEALLRPENVTAEHKEGSSVTTTLLDPAHRRSGSGTSDHGLCVTHEYTDRKLMVDRAFGGRVGEVEMAAHGLRPRNQKGRWEMGLCARQQIQPPNFRSFDRHRFFRSGCGSRPVENLRRPGE